jgi:hypothetical protein
MAKKKASEDAAPTSRASKPPLRIIAGVLIVALLTGSVCLAVWRHVGGHVLSAEQYQVHPELITLTPPPPEWIRPDPGSSRAEDRIKSEVLRDLERLGPLSVLDVDLTVKLAEAFAAHPWVARVDRVSKRFPAGVDVQLVYRAPVAMVELHDGSGVLPVDEGAVLLPDRDFTVAEAERYPLVADIYTKPPAAHGKRWGDAAVLGAAQIAAALGSDWHRLGIARIVPVERKPARSGFEYTYALITKSGTRIDWGRAPGSDTPGEVPAREKIAQLKRYQAQSGGTLDGPEGPWHIEIDGRGALLQKALPQVAPLPAVEDSASGAARPADIPASPTSARTTPRAADAPEDDID